LAAAERLESTRVRTGLGQEDVELTPEHSEIATGDDGPTE
jgi:hypothetical protein